MRKTEDVYASSKGMIRQYLSGKNPQRVFQIRYSTAGKIAQCKLKLSDNASREFGNKCVKFRIKCIADDWCDL